MDVTKLHQHAEDDEDTPDLDSITSNQSAVGPTQNRCKKHPGKPSCYFITEQPWVQLCSKCALNMALCGKKIERRLTQDERKRKLQLEAMVLELKSKSKLIEDKETEVKGRIAIVQADYLVEVESLLRFYDAQIEEWTRKRNEVYKQYSEEILECFKNLEQVRYRFSLSSMELKNSLKKIESNFVTMIHDMPVADFNEEITQHRNYIEELTDSQYEVFDFDKKRVSLEKLVKELVSSTEAFKCSKHYLQSASHISEAVMQKSGKFRPMAGSDSRKHQPSTTPNKKPVLQQQNYFSNRDDDFKLRLRPISQVTTSSSKSKLSDRNKRPSSKISFPKKDDIEMTDVSRMHWA